MVRSMRKVEYVFLSALFSALMHFGVFLSTAKIPVSPIYFQEPVPQEKSRYLKLVSVDLPSEKKEPEREEVKVQLLPTHIPDKPPAPPEKPDLKLVPQPGAALKEGLGEAIEASLKPAGVPEIKAAAMSPKIIEIDGDKLPEGRLEFNRIITPRLPRTSNYGGIGGGGAGGADGGGGLGSGSIAPPIPLKMRMGLPTASLPAPSVPETRLLPPEKLSVLDGLMKIRIFKYELADKSGFFRIDIVPKDDAKGLPPFTKDVAFCVDVSGSISNIKLEEFKEGVRKSLGALNPEDRFEIMAFRQKELPLFGGFRKADQDSLRAAEDFLSGLRREGSTNIYGALKPFTGAAAREGRGGRPLLLFLASDGKVNTGEVVDSRALINRLSNENQEGSSIFTFCTGRGANNFLLDLLAYRNRGESLRTEQVEKSRVVLEKFVEQVSDILVMGLDYQISGGFADSTFPKSLPHLYRRHTLSVYGRYPAGARDAGLRITGTDSLGRRQELIYKADIASAVPADETLMRSWAMQYVYHLYSRLTVAYDEKLKGEIRRTAGQYGLDLPYIDTYMVKK